jgi:hypothetical protein
MSKNLNDYVTLLVGIHEADCFYAVAQSGGLGV